MQSSSEMQAIISNDALENKYELNIAGNHSTFLSMFISVYIQQQIGL